MIALFASGYISAFRPGGTKEAAGEHVVGSTNTITAGGISVVSTPGPSPSPQPPAGMPETVQMPPGPEPTMPPLPPVQPPAMPGDRGKPEHAGNAAINATGRAGFPHHTGQADADALDAAGTAASCAGGKASIQLADSAAARPGRVDGCVELAFTDRAGTVPGAVPGLDVVDLIPPGAPRERSSPRTY